MRRHHSLQSRHLPSSDYVPGPEYPEYLVPSDDEVPIEDQPLPIDASPIALSSGYVDDSDLEEDPKEDPEEDPADYPTDGGDDDDDNDDDDDGDEEEEFSKEGEEEEEEEHLAPADLTPPRSPQTKIPSPPLPVPSPPLPLPSPPTRSLHTSPTYARAPLGYRAAMSKSRSQAMEAQIRALQRDVCVLQRQRINDGDRLTSHI
ncbi:hypothetical protein Tco_1233352 [Tanacetum coccineum]